MKQKNYLLLAVSFVFNNSTAFAKLLLASFIFGFSTGKTNVKETRIWSVINAPTFIRTILVVLIALFNLESYSQTFEPFTPPRFNQELKGNMLLIGNNILGKDNNPLNVINITNEDISMKYIDIDGDATTFNSSSADLTVPNAACSKIIYAGLYWGAILQSGSRTEINKIKLKLPAGTYNDITGSVIYDAIASPINALTGEPKNTPYVCYADVTALISGLSTAQGTYTVANVISNEGTNNSTGLSAGWNLFIVYEDLNLPSKSITSFDGFSSIYDDKTLSITISGFITPPSGLVNVEYAFAGLEGDKTEVGSKTEINGKAITTAERPSNRFFNSTINSLTGYFTQRNPNGSNTLGFDAGIFNIPNPNQSVVGNNVTSAKITLQVAKGQADPFFAYFSAFAVDVIEPEIALTKVVKNSSGVDINNQYVVIGQNLYYEIGFKNIGNDNATNLVIKDVLPDNIIFNYPSDILSVPAGVTYSYNSATKTILFNIPKELVEIGDINNIIKLKVQVVANCSDLTDACSNEIKNQASATYSGTINTNQFTEISFVPNSCNIGTPQATNFFVKIDDCLTKNEVLCGTSVQLTAASGYSSYSWSKSPTGLPVIGINQTLTVTQTGTYYVFDTALAPCQSLLETIIVTPFGSAISNPVIPFADTVLTCPDDGKELPNIFLCGANATRFIQTNISDGSTIVWEKLNEASCAAVTNQNCANESLSCTWTQVGTGPDFNATAAGQYRITLNYPGGCFNRFYFNVYQNLLNPTATKKDIICTVPGEITVGNVPDGYEFSLNPSGPFQDGKTFVINTPGTYTVYIRQKGIDPSSLPCVFTVPDISIQKRDLTVDTILTQPICYSDKGTIKLVANNVQPQYYFSISNSAGIVNSAGPILESDYTFSNLNPGTYTVNVSTEDGCSYTDNVIIIQPSLLTATAVLTKPLTCTDGEITVYPIGGTPPYYYFVNSTTDFQYVPQITVAAPGGDYTIQVVDSKNCVAFTTIKVIPTPAPVFNPITKTNVLCSGGNTGTITVNVSNANGNSLRYSIDNGVTFNSSNVFTGLIAGTYNVVVEYTFGTSVCTTAPQSITIVQPTILTETHTVTPFSCSTTNTKQSATITVVGSGGTILGGTSPYQYSFNNSDYTDTNTLSVNDNGTDQIISYSVRDANGCTVGGSVKLLKLNSPTSGTITNSAVTCNATTSTVTVKPTAGTGVGTLTYEITFPLASATSNTTGIFAGLSPGTYIFKVTDANGCSYTESYPVNPVTNITVSGNVIGDVLCKGGNTGVATFTVSGFSGTYSYSINGATAVTGQSATTINLANKLAGTYAILITDEGTGCTANASVTITEPTNALSASFTTVNANCFIPTSQVTVTPSGGKPNYTYSFVSNGAPAGTYVASNIANLDPNLVWDVWVKDANGCTIKLDLTITKDPTPTVVATAIGQCLGAGSYTITATGSGGVGTLTYSINNGGSYQAGNTFVVTTEGSYAIRVKDANGCTADSAPVVVAKQLTLSAVLNKGITCTPAPTTAQITITTTGGTAPFAYESKEASGSYTPMASNVFNSSVAGSYTFRVKDANGCSAVTTTPIVTVLPVNPHITGVTPTQFINCNGDATAAISIAIDNTKGQSPFVFNVYNNTLSIDYGTQTSGLRAGSYTITVTDAKGCTDTFLHVINEPTVIDVIRTIQPITCNTLTGISLGSITINTVSGGTPNYIYHVIGVNGYNKQFSNQTGTLAVFEVVDFGFYQIIVTDANGCSWIEQNILVASPPDDLDITVSSPPADCSTAGSAIVAVGATSTNLTGSGPFHFAVYSGPGMIYSGPTALPWYDEDAVNSKKATIPNLLAGVTYTFIIHDQGTGCYYFETSSLPIPTQSTLTTSNVVAQNISCKGEADGKVSFDVTSTYPITTNVTYEIYNSQSLVSTLITGSGTVPANGTLPVSNLGPLPFGNYFVLIKEGLGATHSGCNVVTSPFNITESAIDLSVKATKIKNINCNQDGVISAQAKDGTAPYTYQYLLTSVLPPIATTLGWTANTTYATSITGNYIVYTKDAYGCIRQDAVTMEADEDPTITPPAAPICYDGSTPFTITISGTVDQDIVGGATYSINGSAFQTSSSFTFNAAGTYNLVIKDGNGCTATVPYVVYPKLNLAATLTKEFDCTATPDVTITLTTTGGNTTPAANYTYEVSFNSGSFIAASNPYTATSAGNYVFRVTDANNPTLCQATTTFILDPIPTTLFNSPIVTNVSCNGGTDGSIVVNVISGVGPYEYQLNTGTFQPSNVFPGLAAGTTYVVTVRNAKNCIVASSPITIPEPNVLTATSVITAPLSCGAGNASQPAIVTVNGSGGTAPYTYSFNGGANYSASNTYQSYTGTTFNVLVKDSNGCFYTLPNGVDIPALVPPTDLTFSTTASVTCLALGTVEITGHTGGVGTLQYQIISPATAVTNVSGASSGIFTGLAPGTYLFQVKDANGCTYQEAYPINDVSKIAIVGQLMKDVSCKGSADGAMQFTVSNFASTYSYSINGVSIAANFSNPTINLTNQAPNTYLLEVVDDTTGCTSSATVTIAEPLNLLTVSASETTKVSCANDRGTITAAATGGWGTYQYELTGSATVAYSANGTFTNLGAGTYFVNVKDLKGCVATIPTSIRLDKTPISFMATPSSTLLSCFGDTNASITVSNVVGGQGSNYSYTLNKISPVAYTSGPQSSTVFSGLGAGTYTVTVTDGYNCSVTSSSILINEPTEVKASLVVTTPQTCVPTTVLTLSAAGGTPPYTYGSDGITFGSTTFNSSVSIPVGPGTYHYFVKDAKNCIATVSNDIKIDPLPPLVINLDLTNAIINCNGDATGVIVATAQGGLGSYVYTLLDAAGLPISPLPVQVSPGVFTQLVAGVYKVQVDSGADCQTISDPITITQPLAKLEVSPLIVKDVTCAGSNNGQIIITGTSGTRIIKYAISPQLDQFFDTGTFDNLAPGTYDIIVQDEKGCYEYIKDILISEPAPIIASTVPGSIVPEICFGDNNASFSIDISGGVMPYSISLDNINGPFSPVVSLPYNFTGLTGGTHSVYVKDANGCVVQWVVDTPESVKINPVATVNYDCVNNAPNNVVTVTIDPSVDPTKVQYSLDGLPPYQASNVFANIAPGTHFVEVKHANGCIKRTTDFDIIQIDPLTLVLNDGGLNEIVAIANGGSGVYEYSLNGEPNVTTNSFIIYKSGDYTVTVTDSNGCTATATRYFEYIDICIPNYFTPNGDGVSDGWAPGCTINYKDLQFSIFDRYGREIAKYRLGQYWDGKYNGAELPSGDYWYVLKLNDPKDDREFVGHFTLYR
nr:T9SS type B sorting domain-containing protein [uncultured Flavobacterium sp.]